MTTTADPPPKGDALAFLVDLAAQRLQEERLLDISTSDIHGEIAHEVGTTLRTDPAAAQPHPAARRDFDVDHQQEPMKQHASPLRSADAVVGPSNTQGAVPAATISGQAGQQPQQAGAPRPTGAYHPPGAPPPSHPHHLSHLSYHQKAPSKPLIPGGPCENPYCGVVEAPQWRRIEKKLVCNRCGMYYHRHAHFPDWTYFNGLAAKVSMRTGVTVQHRQASPSVVVQAQKQTHSASQQRSGPAPALRQTPSGAATPLAPAAAEHGQDQASGPPAHVPANSHHSENTVATTSGASSGAVPTATPGADQTSSPPVKRKASSSVRASPLAPDAVHQQRHAAAAAVAASGISAQREHGVKRELLPVHRDHVVQRIVRAPQRLELEREQDAAMEQVEGAEEAPLAPRVIADWRPPASKRVCVAPASADNSPARSAPRSQQQQQATAAEPACCAPSPPSAYAPPSPPSALAAAAGGRPCPSLLDTMALLQQQQRPQQQQAAQAYIQQRHPHVGPARGQAGAPFLVTHLVQPQQQPGMLMPRGGAPAAMPMGAGGTILADLQQRAMKKSQAQQQQQPMQVHMQCHPAMSVAIDSSMYGRAQQAALAAGQPILTHVLTAMPPGTMAAPIALQGVTLGAMRPQYVMAQPMAGSRIVQMPTDGPLAAEFAAMLQAAANGGRQGASTAAQYGAGVAGGNGGGSGTATVMLPVLDLGKSPATIAF